MFRGGAGGPPGPHCSHGTEAQKKEAMKAANKEWKKRKRDADYVQAVIQGGGS